MLSCDIWRSTASKRRPNPWSLIEFTACILSCTSSFSKFNAFLSNSTDDDQIDYWARLIDLRCISSTTSIFFVFSREAEDIKLIEFTACILFYTSSFQSPMLFLATQQRNRGVSTSSCTKTINKDIIELTWNWRSKCTYSKLFRKIRQYNKQCSACELNHTKDTQHMKIVTYSFAPNSVQNHSHGFPTGTSWWIRHSLDCDLQNIKASNHYFRKIHMKSIRMGTDTVESHTRCGLGNPWRYLSQIWEPRFMPEFRTTLFKKLGNQVTHVDGITITLRSTISQNERIRSSRSHFDFFITEKPRVRLDQCGIVDTKQTWINLLKTRRPGSSLMSWHNQIGYWARRINSGFITYHQLFWFSRSFTSS